MEIGWLGQLFLGCKVLRYTVLEEDEESRNCRRFVV